MDVSIQLYPPAALQDSSWVEAKRKIPVPAKNRTPIVYPVANSDVLLT